MQKHNKNQQNSKETVMNFRQFLKESRRKEYNVRENSDLIDNDIEDLLNTDDLFETKRPRFRDGFRDDIDEGRNYTQERDFSKDSNPFVPGEKYEPTERDLDRMLDYFLKGSIPHQLATTVRNVNKVMARLFIATAMGWTECAKAFEERCYEKNVSREIVEEIKKQAADYKLPRKYAVGKRVKKSVQAELDTQKSDRDNLKDNFLAIYRIVEQQLLPYTFRESKDGNSYYWELNVVMPSGVKCCINLASRSEGLGWELAPKGNEDVNGKEDFNSYGTHKSGAKLLASQFEALIKANS